MALLEQVLSEQRLRLNFPALTTYSVRIPETITVVVPGEALKTYETIYTAADGTPGNFFVIIPDNTSAESHEVIPISDGETLNDALYYWSERFFTIDPGEAAVAFRIDVDFDATNQRCAPPDPWRS